jgi:predicted nucleic acid-binding protein
VLIQDGESETLALLRQLNAKILVIDERNTRMLVEDIKGLQSYIEMKIGRIIPDEKKIRQLQELLAGIRICRSTELIALAFEQGFLGEELEQNRESLEAALYAVKFSGCAVSDREIQEFLRGK